MKLWQKRLTALMLCLNLLAGLAVGAAAQTAVGTATNSTTHLRTSYSDSNYFDLTISGSDLTVTGKVLAAASGRSRFRWAVSTESWTRKADSCFPLRCP